MRVPPLGPEQVCVGLALMVPPPLADRLRRLRRSCGDPRADSAPPHITVIPPTSVARAALPGLISGIENCAARFQRFRVRLAGTGTFRPVSPVVYARLAEGFDSCRALEAQVRPVVDGLEDRFPYHPHVTIAQDVPKTTLDTAARAVDGLDESFTAGDLDLCLLEHDAVWRPLRRFELARTGSGALPEELI
ncbi:MAG: 2'-5' RNA ligase family protein [Bifidobacteriaceae bacterium]|jgi:2'-5' RNA ligase|nr:2'-5' RNA ligase family protein [Bifidobacteriaceae bacterium]